MKDSNISIDEFAKYVNVSNEEELKAYAEYYRKQLPNAKIRSLYIKSDSVISWFGDTARSLASISIKNILNGFVQEKVEIKFIGYHYEFADDDPTLYNKRRCYSLKGFNDFYVLTEEGYISDIVYKGRYLLLGEKTKLQILPK